MTVKGRVGILHYAAPPVVGGVEITIYHHARLLLQRGYEVHVIAGRGAPFYSGIYFHRVEEVDSRYPDVLAVSRELAGGVVSSRFLGLRDRIANRLRAILPALHTTIVHNALTLHKNLPLTAALYRLVQDNAASLIAWCHDFAWKDELYLPEMHPGYPWDLLRTPWPNTPYVVVSEHRRHMLAELLRVSPQTIHVVPPGVDPYEFYKLEPETRRLVEKLGLLDVAPLLLLPARVTRRKNIEMAIRITSALTHHMPRPTLIVTGPPGPHNPTNVAYLNSLRELTHRLGVENNVHFLYEYGEGDQPLHVSDAMMSDFYQLADVLLFPSRREGFGIPVLEAGLARLPIFASDIPPVHESAGGLAFTFDPEGDPAPVARRIAEVLTHDRAYRMRRRVLQQFTWQRIIDERVIPLIEKTQRDSGSRETEKEYSEPEG